MCVYWRVDMSTVCVGMCGRIEQYFPCMCCVYAVLVIITVFIIRNAEEPFFKKVVQESGVLEVFIRTLTVKLIII